MVNEVTQGPDSKVTENPRVCVLSLREIRKRVSRCVTYEFEDVICEIDEVELLTLVYRPITDLSFSTRVARKIVKRLTGYDYPKPYVSEVRLKRDYDIFFVMCQQTSDLLLLEKVEGWKERCRNSICWLEEVWIGELDKYPWILDILSKFDYVVLSCNGTVQPMQDAIKRPCHYLPPGIDTIRFSPYPIPPLRCIDVLSLGRRAQIIHQSLFKMAEEGQIFYHYDSCPGPEPEDHREHRSLIANIAKRSKYFLVNPAKFDRPEQTEGQSEIGYRFFEGAASGTVMIGESPKNEVFSEHFHWDDAVIPAFSNPPNVAEILSDLNSQTDRLEEIRKNNVIQTHLLHDWVYRWRAVLDFIGMKPMPALEAREMHLRRLVEIASTQT